MGGAGSWRNARRQPRPPLPGSVTDLAADLVFLLVQRPLFSLGDVAAVGTGHRTFFHADLMVLPMQLGGLALADLAFLDFLVDAAGLTCPACPCSPPRPAGPGP